MNLTEKKNILRKEIYQLNSTYSPEWRLSASLKILTELENREEFKSASTVLLYHALPDEIQTAAFIDKWYGKKNILLPVVAGDGLLIRLYNPKLMETGAYNIQEPGGPDLDELSIIDLAIIPGVAFDRQGNRLGRGKGYYDRLLPRIDAPKFGVCFSFRLFDEIPIDRNDVKMDQILTNNEIIIK